MSVCCDPGGGKMAATALQSSSEKDVDCLEKLIKVFASKSAQVIVQARLGSPIETKCNPDSTQTDWFNLAIKDLPEVTAETKKAISAVGSRLPLCIEISLRTNEQETMTLETWCVGINKDAADPTMRVTHPLYTRMGILLKSVITLTRLVPAYRISRKESDYVMCYRIYVGEPQHSTLGTALTQMTVGQVITSLGTLYVKLAYRTKLTISPQPTSDSSIMVKSDHFHSDVCPADPNLKNCGDLKTSLLNLPVKIGAFADRIKPVEPEPVDIPFSNLLIMPKQSPITTTTTVAVDSSSGDESARANDNVSVNTADSDNGNFTQPDEPFVLLDLKTPFAGKNANSELGQFYREVIEAPQLQISNDETVEDQIGDLDKQLEMFESNLKEYDNVLSSVCLGDNNN